jgi:hypothetical protein
MLVLLGAVYGIVSAVARPGQEKPGRASWFKVASNRWATSSPTFAAAGNC